MPPKICWLWLLLSTLALAQPPAGYDYVRQFGKPCRLRVADLPWQLYNAGGHHPDTVAHVVGVYNREAARLGLPPFYEITTVAEAANLTIDWSGRGLPGDKAAGVFWDAGLGYKRVLGLSMDGLHRLPAGNRAQILMQELGHVLGLGDSRVESDVMHPVMHRRRYYRISQIDLTARDRAALAALYRSAEWVPILGRGQVLKKKTPAPQFTPIPAETNEEKP